MLSLSLAELHDLDSMDYMEFKQRSIQNILLFMYRFLVKSQTLRRDLESLMAGYQIYPRVNYDDQNMKSLVGELPFICFRKWDTQKLLWTIGLVLQKPSSEMSRVLKIRRDSKDNRTGEGELGNLTGFCHGISLEETVSHHPAFLLLPFISMQGIIK